MITAHDLHNLAVYLLDRHGPTIIEFADHAVVELEAKGDDSRAGTWRVLRSVVQDMVDGRLSDSAIQLH